MVSQKAAGFRSGVREYHQVVRDDPGIILLGAIQEHPEPLRHHKIVAVQHCDPFASRGLKAHIARCTGTAIHLLLDYPYAGIAICGLFRDRDAVTVEASSTKTNPKTEAFAASATV
jgi:hypothetical protein